MVLTSLDFIIIGLFILITLALGWYAKSTANQGLEGFFLGGKNLPWYLAGLSMVATTFAADTPLAVTELVAQNGISGNWVWWNMLLGGMFTAVFYAQLWRRSGVVTDAEFITLRYAGKPAQWLKKFKAVYLGLFMNAIILAWVNLALMAILEVFFGITGVDLYIYTGIAMLMVAGYSALSGLLGVALTDAFQFFIALTGCIVLAVLVVNSDQIGGISALKEALPEGSLKITPGINSSSSSTLTMGLASFIAFAGMVWWSSWYPGAEPGGGGYIAQRMFSTKNEKHSFLATFFFQLAHYGLRPWPWIIVALCSVILYPDLAPADQKLGFVMAMKDFLPAGMRGLLLVAFLGAYMSTVSTHLNWGASYIVNDVWNNRGKSDKSIVKVSRITTFAIMIIAMAVTTQVTSISGVWEFIMECGAGLGLLLMLRWFWFRISAWAEIAATVTPFIVYAILKFGLSEQFPNLKESISTDPTSFFITVGVTTLVWVVISLLSPKHNEQIETFKAKIYPEGFNQFRLKIPYLFTAWIGGIAIVYSFLFMVGKIIFKDWNMALIFIATFVLGALLFYFSANKAGLFKSKSAT